MSLDFDPLEFFKQELSSDEIFIKVNAIHRIKVISTVIGSSRVEQELIPYLSSIIPKLEDESLFALSQELGILHLYVNDSPGTLLPLLEALASAEESLVREQAVFSLIELASYLSDYQLIHTFVGTVLKLSSSETFTAKISACKLFTAAYPRAGGYREKLRGKLIELCQDDNYMIRKAAAEQIEEMISIVEKHSLVNEIFPIIKILNQDEQEEIRIICIKFIRKLCGILNKEEVKALLMPLLTSFQEDSSWKVRLAFADEIYAISETSDLEFIENVLLQNMVFLMHDTENEVKIGMLRGAVDMVKKISPEKMVNLMFPIISSFFQDEGSQMKIKMVCADIIVEVWKIVNKEFCLNSIFPIVEGVFADNNKDLKLKFMENLHVFGSAGGDFVVVRLRPILEECWKDTKNWRLRRKVLKSIVKLTLMLGSDIFTSSLSSIFLRFITDPVCSIRNTGSNEIKKLSKCIDQEWFLTILYPKLQELYSETTWYLHKVCIIHILGNIPGDYLSIFNMACKDSVSNVKIAVCKVIQQMIDEKKDISAYNSFIYELRKDKDRDVAYLAFKLE